MSWWARQAGANTALKTETQWHNEWINLFSHVSSSCFYLSYRVCCNVFFVSCPMLRIKFHWPSEMRGPVTSMLRSVNWAWSNSQCTRKVGPEPITTYIVGGRQQLLCLWWSIWQLYWKLLTFYCWVDCRSKKTPPLCLDVKLSADLWHNSSPIPVWQKKPFAPNLSSLIRSVFPSIVPTHSKPSFTASVGPQLWTCVQSPGLYCFLSRTHPESDRPLTCTPWWPWDRSCSSTWSTFTKTPIPPALKEARPAIISVSATTYTDSRGIWIYHEVVPELTWHLPGEEP